MHNVPDLGDFGYVPTNINSNTSSSFSGLWKGVLLLLIIGALLFLVFEFFFKDDDSSKDIASEIRKSLKNDNTSSDI